MAIVHMAQRYIPTWFAVGWDGETLSDLQFAD